jgi:hypothetical protein
MRLATRPGRPAVLAAFFSVALALSAQPDLAVYRDSLVNGFEGRLWLSHTLTNSFPIHAGDYSISVAPTSHFQLTPNGSSNTFYVDDVQFNAKTAVLAAHSGPDPAVGAEPGPGADRYWNTVALCIAGALIVMTALLAWLIVMLRRSGLGTSQALVRVNPVVSAHGLLADAELNLPPGAVRHALEELTEPQAKALRDRVVAELAEFAKQQLVQGLYSQRNQLLETEQKAQAELAELEARLTALHLPLQERIRAYETRIGELTKQLETRDEEMQHLIHATVLLVRERLEKEKAAEASASRFN